MKPAEHAPTADARRSRRLILALAVFGALSFVGGILLAVLDPGETAVASYEADTFSRSAIGHRGLVRWLRALDVPVVVSRAGSARKAREGTVLAIFEPPFEDETGRLTRLIEEASADAVILALPKWTGREHRETDGWIARLQPVSHDERDRILDRLGLDLRSVDAGEGAWDWQGDTPPGEVALRAPVGVTGAIEPLLSRGEAVVIGRVQRDGTPLYVVADPDLLGNAGLVTHAPLLVEVLRPLLAEPPRALVVDETLHGYLSTASLARQLFEFPLAALTAQAAAMLILALLAGMRRFGAPQPRPPARGGRRVLIENTAALGRYAGHDAPALERYWQTTLTGVRKALHAPGALDRAGLYRWLTRIGEGRGVEDGPIALAHAAESVGPAERVATARRIHRWRRAMLARPASKTDRRSR